MVDLPPLPDETHPLRPEKFKTPPRRETKNWPKTCNTKTSGSHTQISVRNLKRESQQG